MSYPCGPNTLGKTHRMKGPHPNPGKTNFRRSDPRHPKFEEPLLIPTVSMTRAELQQAGY